MRPRLGSSQGPFAARRCFDDLLDSVWIDEDDGQARSRVADDSGPGERSLGVDENRVWRVTPAALLVRGQTLVLGAELGVSQRFFDAVRDGPANRPLVRRDRGHAPVTVMNTRTELQAARRRKLGEAVGEVADAGAGPLRISETNAPFSSITGSRRRTPSSRARIPAVPRALAKVRWTPASTNRLMPSRAKAALEDAIGDRAVGGTDPQAAAEYTELKRGLARRFRYDREAYTEAKSEFIRRILDRRT